VLWCDWSRLCSACRLFCASRWCDSVSFFPLFRIPAQHGTDGDGGSMLHLLRWSWELKQRAILTTGLSFVDEPWSVLCSYCGGDPFIELSSRILFSCNDKIAMTWFPVILFLLCFQRNFIKNLQVVYLDDVEWCFWCIFFFSFMHNL